METYSNELNNCFKKGELKKTIPNLRDSKQDIKQAEFFLSEAEDLIDLGKKEFVMLALYNTVFHAGRAILNIQGIKERSHYCLQKYLSENSTLTQEDIYLFDKLRIKRTKIQYDLEKTSITENLDELYNHVEDFIEKVKKEINYKENPT
jgi:uncharacterized protein (UPF0332 family)